MKKYFNISIINIVIRGIAGLFPLYIAFLLPKLIGNNLSSNFFSSLATVTLVSAIIRLGQDMIILKTKATIEDLQSIFYVQSVNFIAALIISYFININVFFIVACYVYSLNVIISFYYLSIERKVYSVLIQFIIPSIIILIIYKLFSVEYYSSNFIIIFSYSLPISYMFFKVFILMSRNWNKMKYKLNIKNFSILLYTIFSISISTIPIIISKKYANSNLTVDIYQTMKFISLSSFVSSLIIFSFNSDLRLANKIKMYTNFKRFSLLLIVFFSFIVFLASYFEMFNFNIFIKFSLPLVMLIILISNIIGHYFILHSLEKFNLFSIAFSVICLLGFLLLLEYIKLNQFILQLLYILLLLVEAFGKFIFFINIKEKMNE